jgi:hypothetical protein
MVPSVDGGEQRPKRMAHVWQRHLPECASRGGRDAIILILEEIDEAVDLKGFHLSADQHHRQLPKARMRVAEPAGKRWSPPRIRRWSGAGPPTSSRMACHDPGDRAKEVAARVRIPVIHTKSPHSRS